MTAPISVTDGVVSLRAGSPAWARVVIYGQAAGSATVDVDSDWLGSGEAAVGLQLVAGAAAHNGAAFRTLQLLVHHLALRTAVHTTWVRLAEADGPGRAAAVAAGFTDAGRSGLQRAYRRPVPPVTYTDGVVSIRRQRVEDIDAHMAAIDDAQIDWLWGPDARPGWEALSPEQQRAGNLAHLRGVHDSFGSGPKWTFSVDGRETEYIAYIDCDLANNHVPAGQANISYTCHPAHRGNGYVSRAVRLVTRFLHDHTGAAEAHIIVDEDNVPSLHVARAVGAAERDRFRNEHNRTMIRHVLPIR